MSQGISYTYLPFIIFYAALTIEKTHADAENLKHNTTQPKISLIDYV